MKKLLAIFLAVALVAMTPAGPPDDKDTNSRLKALYIYNFSKNVDWPESYKSGNFIIGVVGEHNVYNKLISLYSSKSIGSQPIEIKKFAKVSEVGKCHVLFLPEESSDMLPDIVKSLSKSSTLLVTETDGGLDKGSIINFVVVDNRLSFEIHAKTASKRKLIIGNQLIELAHHVVK